MDLPGTLLEEMSLFRNMSMVVFLVCFFFFLDLLSSRFSPVNFSLKENLWALGAGFRAFRGPC